ncbi:AAA family ATPase [Pseudarthrobacter scleromae]|uniref:AAA family ATPase n=1 Tax=Pseudarthrobacter scleromae TaxID=158897 RepID=UPI003D091624
MDKMNNLHTTGQLREIRIQGLFGQRDLRLVLGRGHPTVLTGPNGSGKSTVLRIVYAAGKLDTFQLLSYRFQRLQLLFDAGDEFTVEKDDEANRAFITWRGHTHDLRQSESLHNLPLAVRELLIDSDYDPERALVRLTERGPRGARSLADYRLARSVLADLDSSMVKPELPAWLEEFTKYFPVEFISDRRLQEALDVPDLSARGLNDERAIVVAANHIGMLLSQAQARYGRGTERLDMRLSRRVVEAMRSGSSPSQEEVLRLADAVRSRSRDLRAVGLLETREQEDDIFLTGAEDPVSVRQVVAAILQSTLERLDQLNEVENQLRAFKHFLDRRLSDKSVHLGGRRGMMFETLYGHQIRPDQLSSGEQHLVILAFDLIFGRRRNSLVIIDEPEISLHVAWQDHLLADFMNLGRGRKLKFLMASHAPSLIAQMPECEFPMGADR